jgi:hypothetical protein
MIGTIYDPPYCSFRWTLPLIGLHNKEKKNGDKFLKKLSVNRK